jgi:lambda family phage portal protein
MSLTDELAAILRPDAPAMAALPAPAGQSMSVPEGAAFNHPVTATWLAYRRDQDDAMLASAELAAGRAFEVLCNSGWIAGAIETACAQIIGPGLRLQAKPVPGVTGMSPEDCNAWADTVETAWRAYAETEAIDVYGRTNAAGIQRAALRSYFGGGEILALHTYDSRPGEVFRSKVHLLDPARIDEGGSTLDTKRGIRFKAGRPDAVMLRDKDPVLGTELMAKPVPFKSRSGKPMASLIFDQLVPGGQTRGVTPLLPALRVLKQLDQLEDAHLQTALWQAISAATITSNAASLDVADVLGEPNVPAGMSLADYASAKAAWYKSRPINLKELNAVHHLLPGESLEFKGTDKGAAQSFEIFLKALQLEIASALAMSFEAFSGDYSDASYSSVRMSNSGNWPKVLHRRKNIVGRFMQDVYSAWLETEIIHGRIRVPGGIEAFWALRPYFTSAEWVGPPKPSADALKDAKAAEIRLENGLTSLAFETAEIGLDAGEQMALRKRESEQARAMGLPDPHGINTARTPRAGGMEDNQ